MTENDNTIKPMTMLFGMGCGAYVGLVLGAIAAACVGYWSILNHPDDPSAGSVSTIVIFTGPAGAVLFAGVAATMISIKRRWFMMTLVPLGILFLCVQSVFMALSQIDRPRHFVIEVIGTQGAEFVSVISVDGKRRVVSGILPQKHEVTAMQVEIAAVLNEPAGNDYIAIEVSADGTKYPIGPRDQTGLHIRLRSSGYSERFGGTSRGYHRMSQEEIDTFLAERKMPRQRWLP